jgi:hypothetical protein
METSERIGVFMLRFIAGIILFGIFMALVIGGMPLGLGAVAWGKVDAGDFVGVAVSCGKFMAVFLILAILVTLVLSGIGALMEGRSGSSGPSSRRAKPIANPRKLKKPATVIDDLEEMEWQLDEVEVDEDLNARMEQLYESAGRDQEEEH